MVSCFTFPSAISCVCCAMTSANWFSSVLICVLVSLIVFLMFDCCVCFCEILSRLLVTSALELMRFKCVS